MVWKWWRETQCVLLAMLMVLLNVFPAVAETSNSFIFSFLPRREYAGTLYEARPSADLTTVLLIGYDHHADGGVEEMHGYSNGGQCDFLLLLVVDHVQQKIYPLQIDRDTMAPIYVTDINGKQHWRKSLQICLAHAYGDTREKNNANTVLAVETLMGINAPDDGVAINWYLAMDISGISKLNDVLGGVTVTLEDDMTFFDPAMTEGATLKLTGKQAEYFCRGRYDVGDQTNASRMKRHQQFISAASDVLVQKLKEDVNFGSQLLEQMGFIYDRSTAASSDPFSFSDPVTGTPVGQARERYLMTNESQSEIVGLLARAMEYEIMDTEILPGEHVIGNSGYIEYRLEPDSAIKWALQHFYRCE